MNVATSTPNGLYKWVCCQYCLSLYGMVLNKICCLIYLLGEEGGHWKQQKTIVEYGHSYDPQILVNSWSALVSLK